MYKKLITLTMAIASICSANAAKHMVGSAEEIAALKSLKAGDTIVVRNGTYTDLSITFDAVGTKDQPIVLTGETAGSVVLTGASKLSFGGDWIVVRDLWFKDVALTKGGDAIINFKNSKRATNSVVTECAITGKGLTQSLTDYKWVSLYGTHNTVSHCTFTDKRNMGTLLVVWLEKGITPLHTIQGNYFSRPHKILDDNGKAINGQETIRIGTSDYSMQNAQCTVKDNFLFRCNGETEIISNKSCENLYTNNTFTECDGCLTLRHGNRCTVYGNYFFGNGAANTGGVRIIGQDHRVYNNYFNSLTGKGYTSAICTVQGIKDTPLNGYYKALNVDIVFNTIVNCKTGITINYGTVRQNEAVSNINIANNVVYNNSDPKSVAILYVDTYSPENIKWSNNIYFGAKISGITLEQAQAANVDPQFIEKNGLFLPIAKSQLMKYSTKDFTFVQQDITGALRPANSRVPGAFTLGSERKQINIPSSTNSGTSWKQTL